MATRDEIKEMFKEFRKEMNDDFSLIVNELREQNAILQTQITTLNDKTERNMITLREDLKSEFRETIDIRIRETEERSRFMNYVLEEKVDKNRGHLIDIIDHGYKQAKQRLEEASTDFRASIKAIDEKTGESLTLMNKQIDINDERAANNFSKMKLNYENIRDHVVKSLTTADNNLKDFDRRLSLMLDDDIPSKVATELVPITASFDLMTTDQHNMASRLVVLEHSVSDLITIKDDTPKLLDERLVAVNERILKLEKAKPAMLAVKADIPSESGRPLTPPVWRDESPLGAATMRSFSLVKKASSGS